jgi:hypothetical protein
MHSLCNLREHSNTNPDTNNYNWVDVITLTTTRLIFVSYHFSFSSSGYIVGTIFVDDVEQPGTISVTGGSGSDTYATGGGHWFGSLSTGAHSIKVRYYANVNIAFDLQYKGKAFQVVAL